MEFNEKNFKEKAKKEILKCRSGDWAHALRVVSWVKKIGIERKDLKKLIFSAYIHDLGWRGIKNKNKLSFLDLKNYKSIVKKNSPKFAREFLINLNFKDDEIKKILRLIKATEDYKAKSEDEKIIVDADNLSKLCLVHLKQKYQKNDWEKMIVLWRKEFPRRIKTKIGKSLYPELIKKLEKSARVAQFG